MNNPSVAIIILNWNTSHFLKRFLPSVLSASYPNKEIYVIDNNSIDDSVSMLNEHFPTVNVLRMYSNKGYASGYNLCFSQIKADYYLLLNSDIEVTANFIEPVISLMEDDELIAICQPKLLSLDDKQMFEYAGASGGWIDILGYPFTRGRVLTTIEKDLGQYDSTEEIFWASGACMFIKAFVIEKIGGFYDYYFMHQEDIDLCWRTQNAGYKICVCPDSVVYHIGGGSLSWEDGFKTYLTFRNNYILLTRNLPLSRLLPIVILRLFLDIFGCIYFIVKKKYAVSNAMIKAEIAYIYWLIFNRDKKNYAAKGFNNKTGVYKSAILFPYFFNNKRKFSEIVTVASGVKKIPVNV